MPQYGKITNTVLVVHGTNGSDIKTLYMKATLLVVSFVFVTKALASSQLDYCNSFFGVCPNLSYLCCNKFKTLLLEFYQLRIDSLESLLFSRRCIGYLSTIKAVPLVYKYLQTDYPKYFDPYRYTSLYSTRRFQGCELLVLVFRSIDHPFMNQ